jgi:hypothetical protein
VEDGQVLLVGSRSGAMLALCFFALVFGGLTWVLARRMRMRGLSSQVTRWVSISAFAVPMMLIYVSSMRGFYEAEARGSGVSLTGLFPTIRTYVDRASVARVDATPWQRGTWRVHIVLATGEDRVSAQTSKEVATAAADALRVQLVR